MSAFLHGVDDTNTLDSSGADKRKWIPVKVDPNGNLKVSLGTSLSGEDTTNDVLVVEQGRYGYETVAASQTDQVLGSTGAAGDYIENLVCVVSTAATSQVQIGDGASAAVVVLPNNVGGGVGTYTIPIHLTSVTGDWRVTTAAGVAVVAVGRFT